MARLIDLGKDKGAAGLQGRRTGDRPSRSPARRRARATPLSELASKYLPRWTVAAAGRRPGLHHERHGRQRGPQRRRQPGEADDRQPHQRVRRHRAGDPGDLDRLPHRRAAPRRRRLRARAPADQEHRLPRVPHRPRSPRGAAACPAARRSSAAFGGTVPDDLEILDGDQRDRETQAVVGKTYYAVEKRRTVTGRDLNNARPGQGQFGQPIVEFTLKPAGADAFGELTGENVGTGARHRARRPGRLGAGDQLAHHRPRPDRGRLHRSRRRRTSSTVLRSGALPASITYLEERTVGPSLGRDSIRDGLRAGIVGTLARHAGHARSTTTCRA